MKSKYYILGLSFLFPVLSAVICLISGKVPLDYDFLNYHFYVADTFWNHRVGYDFLGAGVLSYVNPLLDMPWYIIGYVFGSPRLATGIIAAFQGLSVPLLAVISYLVMPKKVLASYPFLPILVAILGYVTPLQVSDFGSGTGDGIEEVFILSSLLCIFLTYSEVSVHKKRALLVGAGLIAGTACVLKLIFYLYVLPSFVCLLFVGPGNNFKERLTNVISFALGCSISVAAVGGWWWLEIWGRYQDPLFPFYTKFFPSPFIQSIGNMDTGFGPKTFGQMIAWPFVFSFFPSKLLSFYPKQIGMWGGVFHSYGWGVFFILSIVVALKSFFRRYKVSLENKTSNAIKKIEHPFCAASAESFLVFWLLGCFIIWEFQFSIYRYICAADLFIPLAIMILSFKLFSKKFELVLSYISAKKEKSRHHCCHEKCGLIFGLFVLLTAFTVIWLQDYGKNAKGIRWGTPFFKVETQDFSPASFNNILIYQPTCKLFFLPNSWLIPFFEKQTKFFWLQGDFEPGISSSGEKNFQNVPLTDKYYELLKDKVKLHPDNSFILLASRGFDRLSPSEIDNQIRQVKTDAVKTLAKINFQLKESQCHKFSFSVGSNIGGYELCPVAVEEKTKN